RLPGPALVGPEPVGPRARHETQVGPPAGGKVERRYLTGQLDGMESRRIEGGGADPHAFGRARDQEQRIDGRLEEQVVEDGDNVETGGFGAPRERGVLLRALV